MSGILHQGLVIRNEGCGRLSRIIGAKSLKQCGQKIMEEGGEQFKLRRIIGGA